MKYRLPLLILWAILLFVSCGPRRIGFGVILWEDPLSETRVNEIVSIYIDSSIRDSYTHAPLASGQMREDERWRIAFFPSRRAAEEFAAGYEPYKNLMARTLNNGLPVRERPDPLSDRVYRLRLDEIIKILGRQENQTEVGQFTGYWYKVLTADGVQGYCFDHYLEIFDRTTVVPESEDDGLSPNLQVFFDSTYVPDYYRNMATNQAVDLERFRSEYGLFPDYENSTIRLVTDSVRREFGFEDIVKLPRERYEFSGTDLVIQFMRPTYLNAAFSVDGREYSMDFVVMPRIDEIIEEEKQRRADLLEGFITPSGRLQSSAYGTMEISAEGRFRWTDFDRLVPRNIPASYGLSGSVHFNHFIASGLRQQFNGVISLLFDQADRDSGRAGYIHFLYSRRQGGIQLTTLTGINPRNKIFDRQSADPVIMFFSYLEPEPQDNEEGANAEIPESEILD